MKNVMMCFAVTAAMLLGAAAPVAAADLVPVKAPPSKPLDFLHPYTGDGLYVGVYSLGGGGSAQGTVPGANPASLTTLQGAIGGLVGYGWTNSAGNVFVAAEGMVGWTNLNGQANGLSLNGPVSAEERVLLGTPLSTLANILPGFGNLGGPPPLPALPAGVTAGNVHPYLMASLHEDDVSLNFGGASNTAWSIAPGVGLGAITQLSNGLAIDTWFETVFPGKGFCVGVANDGCATLGQKYIAGVALKF